MLKTFEPSKTFQNQPETAFDTLFVYLDWGVQAKHKNLYYSTSNNSAGSNLNCNIHAVGLPPSPPFLCIVMGRLMDKSCDAETKSAIRKMYPNIAEKIR